MEAPLFLNNHGLAKFSPTGFPPPPLRKASAKTLLSTLSPRRVHNLKNRTAMFFGLGNLFYVSILLVNAVAVLSEDRFLARIGWGSTASEPAFGASVDQASVKSKLINLISSVRTLMRIPLIVINTLVIVYELVLG